MSEPSSSKKFIPADLNPHSHLNSISGSGSDPGPTTDSDESETSCDLDIDIAIRRKEDAGFTLEVSRKDTVVEDVYAHFIVDMHQTHDIAIETVRDGIEKITPYVPIKFTEKDGKQLPAPFDDLTDALVIMDAAVPPDQNHCLFLVEMKPSFPYPKRRMKDEKHEVREEKENEDRSAWVDLLRSMQQQRDADRMRSQLAEQRMEAEVEKMKEGAKKMKEEAKKMKEEAKKMKEEAEKMKADIKLLRSAEVNMKGEIELSRSAELRLQEDLTREKERATQAEELLEAASATQAENQRDTDEFIASGCREDTTAYYRIKIRHLVNLVQAQLAHYTSSSMTRSDEREAARRWRQYCSSTALANLSLDQKVDKAKQLVLSKRKPKDRTATDVLINSGALAVLIDDSSLRAIGDAAAHPGPLTKANVKEYRRAIDSIKSYDGIGKPDLERQLGGCVDYLLHVSDTSA